MEGDEGGGVDFLAQMEEAIQRFEAGDGEVDGEAPKATELFAKDAGDTDTEPAKPAEAPVVPPKPDPEVDRGLARLVAREAEIAAKEKAIEDQRRSLGSVLSNLRRGNIAEAFKAIGADEAEIPKLVRVAMATQLPDDKVPEQYRKIKDELVLEQRFREQQSEVEALRAELKQEREAAALAKARQDYEAGLDTFLGAPGDELPTLAKLASTNKQKARERVMAVVVADAQKKAAAYQAGQLKAEEAVPMSPAEAAKIVEQELAEYAALFSSNNGNASTQPPKTVAKGKPSLSNQAARPTATRQTSGDEDMDLVDRVDAWLAGQNL